jgi:hypothetical protein
VRSSRALLAGLACLSACSASLTSRVDLGATGGADAAAAGAPGAVDAGVGQPPSGICEYTPAACACDSQQPECQPLLASLCLGSLCPPTLDQAMLVANWPVDMDGNRDPRGATGDSFACGDGTRTFTFQQGGMLHGFGFDRSGRLAGWWTLPPGSMCSTLACGGTSTPGHPVCLGCPMFANPPPAGTFKYPDGTYNGFAPPCEIDANGRWFVPGFDHLE